MNTKSIFVENSYHLVGTGNNGDTLELSEFRSLRKKLCSAGTRSLRRGCSLASSVIFEKTMKLILRVLRGTKNRDLNSPQLPKGRAFVKTRLTGRTSMWERTSSFSFPPVFWGGLELSREPAGKGGMWFAEFQLLYHKEEQRTMSWELRGHSLISDIWLFL